ncbi:hypothetical protein KKE68_03440, partial [Patescibacteria group bacterium]|nr:hypothetical protein [Patescibacteria group bacterium]
MSTSAILQPYNLQGVALQGQNTVISKAGRLVIYYSYVYFGGQGRSKSLANEVDIAVINNYPATLGDYRILTLQGDTLQVVGL